MVSPVLPGAYRIKIVKTDELTNQFSQPDFPPPNVTTAILESISDGVFTIDHDWCITCFNRAAEEITGIAREDALGRKCWEVFRSNMCENACPLRQTMADGQPVVNQRGYLINAEGQQIPVAVSTGLLKTSTGEVIGGVETFRDLSEETQLRKQLQQRYELGDMVTHNHRLQTILEVLPQVAASDASVLIQGETGTGKEVLARTLHHLSPRADKPFVAVNCAALPDNLLESELFGYKSGAFTGADQDKPGRFALAHGGTLLLDEIGDISQALQVRLLRVLQEKSYEPLGAVASEPADVRIVTATNRNLEQLVGNGQFREDLYYRIKVIRFEIPPLRERREDIPFLADRFLEQFALRYGRPTPALSPSALQLLLEHDYPGNVRELENLIEHALVLCDGNRLEVAHFPRELWEKHPLGISPNLSLTPISKELTAETIQSTLAQHGYNRSAAARALGIHKSTLYRKIKAYNLALPASDGRSAHLK